MMGREDKGMKEEMKLEFDAISENEGLARVVIAAFLTRLDPTLEQLQDVKTAVSEAVTNAVIHGYEEKGGKIRMSAVLEKDELEITIEDDGIGIEDVSKAMQPLFTTKPEGERSGMGFSFMEAFMDKVKVDSSLGNGTTVHMWKSFQGNVLLQNKFFTGQV
ncbi:MAG: anti-sigma F factor [Lachnospiraceae bacterium]|nr:anti-sigma F factor [Lachnospiraceae bacterium]